MTEKMTSYDVPIVHHAALTLSETAPNNHDDRYGVLGWLNDGRAVVAGLIGRSLWDELEADDYVIEYQTCLPCEHDHPDAMEVEGAYSTYWVRWDDR